ncbi:MAG: hypothetical protein ACT4OY_08205 [Alphaproteobacteria bacterium]
MTKTDPAQMKKAQNSGDDKEITRVVQNIMKFSDHVAACKLAHIISKQSPGCSAEALALFNTKGLTKAESKSMLRDTFSAKDGWPDNMFSTLPEISARFGRYTFSFPQCRYLSQSFNESSLLERYGMQRLKRDTDIADPTLPEPDKDLFGPGFRWNDDEWYVEYRRAYVICSRLSETRPATIVIRNSSYYFGRDRLAAPAYVSWKSFTSSDLENLNPHSFDSSGPFTRWQDVFAGGAASNDKVQQISETFDFLDRFDEKVSHWIGHEGFDDLKKFLETRLPLPYPSAIPYLAVVDKGMPPWFPKASVLVTPELVELMQEGALDELLLLAENPNHKFVLLSGASGDLPVKPAF